MISKLIVQLMQQLNSAYLGAETYSDHRELLKDKSIDVVYVLTPNNSHSPLTVDALGSR